MTEEDLTRTTDAPLCSPDILVTNYKMLDYGAVSSADARRWRLNEPVRSVT